MAVQLQLRLVQTLALALALTLCLSAASYAQSADDSAKDSTPSVSELQTQAESRLQQAQSDLDQTRMEITRARAELLEQLQDAYDQRKEARSKLSNARASLQEMQAKAEQESKAFAAWEARTRRDVQALADALELDLPDGDLAEVLPTLASQIEAALDAQHAATLEALQTQVVKALVVQADGSVKQAEIYRFADQRAAMHDESNGAFIPLARLPGGEWRVIADPPAQPDGMSESLTLIGVSLTDSPRVLSEPEAFSLIAWIKAGGFFVWPILIAGLIGLCLIAERVISLQRARPRASWLPDFEAALASGNHQRAQEIAESSRTPAARVARAGMRFVQEHGREHAELEHALDAEIARQEPVFERSITFIAALAAIAPLLGLLGTVTGMIATFGVLASEGAGDPTKLSGGISVALTTTQLGLIVAVPLLLAHAWVKRASTRGLALLDATAACFMQRAEANEPDLATGGEHGSGA